MESPSEFAIRLNLSFVNLSLLTRALTHRSYLNEHPHALEDNERLEFLGDAVLSFITAAWLYHHFPEMAEGELTSMRAALVRNDQLADFAREIDLGNAILMGRGELDSGGRDRSILLGSVFEAILGAIYLDGGIEEASKFVVPKLEKAIRHVLVNKHALDPKSHLQEYTQSKSLGTPQYRTISTSGPLHQPTYMVEVLVGDEVYGTGTGSSKQAATKSAAESALKRLSLNP